MPPASPALLVSLALLAACSSQQDKELAAVKSARSVTAEWAMIERLAADRKVTRLYAGETRAREEILSALPFGDRARTPVFRQRHPSESWDLNVLSACPPAKGRKGDPSFRWDDEETNSLTCSSAMSRRIGTGGA